MRCLANNSSIPSDFNQMMTVARYELLKYLRSRRLLGLFALEFLMIALIMIVPPALGRDYPEDPAEFSKVFIQWVWFLIVIGVTLLASDSLVSEFQSRTGYLLFPNPIKKRIIFAGKFLASVAIIFVALSIFYGISSILVFAVDGGLSNLTASSFGLALLFGIAATSVAYLVSSVMKGSTGALVMTFALFLLIFSIVDGILTFAKVKPNFSISFAAGAIEYIMETPYPTDFIRQIPIGNDVLEIAYYYPEVTTAVIVAIVYIIAALAAAMVIFSRREMAA